MPEKTVQVVMMQPRGNPLKGGILARGATVDLPETWAERFIKDGAAVAATAATPKPAKEKPAKAETQTAKAKKK